MLFPISFPTIIRIQVTATRSQATFSNASNCPVQQVSCSWFYGLSNSSLYVQKATSEDILIIGV